MGTLGMVTKGANWRGPGTNTKRSQVAFAVKSTALTLEPLDPKCWSFPCSLERKKEKEKKRTKRKRRKERGSGPTQNSVP